MTNKRWFQIGIGILLALLIIRMFMEVGDIFRPLFIIAQTIFLPLLLGGVLFYLSRPLIHRLEDRNVPRWGSILIVFAILVFAIWLFSGLIGPAITKQVNALVDNAPELSKDISDAVDYMMDQRDKLPPSLEKSLEQAQSRVNDIAVNFGTWIISFIQSFFQGLFLVVLVPFFLVYMLKDHEKFAPFVASFFHGETKTWVRKTLSDIDSTLKSYIQGQLVVSFAVGVMLFIGYLIIGLDYALLLAIFGMFMNVIPFLGPYIAVVPALIIGIIQEPQMAIYVAIVMLVSQQIESNLISPNVMGKALNIHPLTVITLILAAGNIAGLWGIILAIPTYAVIKTIVKNMYARRDEIKEAATREID